jgi:hypothetical protein
MTRPKTYGNLFAMRKYSFSARTVTKWRSSDSARMYSEALTSVTQFVQRDEVNVRLRVSACGLLPIGKRAFVNVKRLKCALSLFGPYLVKDSDFTNDR